MKILKIPFIGHKADRYIEIENYIKENKFTTVVEIFGGSMCLSVNLLKNGAIKTAYCNDYDGISKKLRTWVELTDKALKESIAYIAPKKRQAHFD